MGKRACIIGAGIAGIASAIRLADKGFDVVVFESNSYPGGKLSELHLNGFRFDAGPSLFTLPHLVDELFTLAGEDPLAYFSYVQLPVNCKYFYEDRTVIEAFADKEAFAEEIFHKIGEPKRNIYRAIENSAFLYKHLAPLFMHRSLHKFSTFTNKQAVAAYKNLFKLDFFRTMSQANESFFKDERLVQLFNRYATYNGSDPYQTPATMNIIPHLEFSEGAYFPKEGMYSITNSLVGLAERLGVKFYYNQSVERITVENAEATGIQIGGEYHLFDKVICNMDMVNAYKKLLPPSYRPKYLLNQPKSSSALIYYWGINAEFPALDLHNIFFSKDYKSEFDYIFNKKDITKDPTVYVNITSKYRKEDAPQGSENWFTMINVPNNSGQDWDKMIAESRINIIRKLSRLLGEEIEKLIIEEAILDPRLIESKTSSAQGALYGNSSNNKMAAFLRHANFSSKIKNLYFCGGSVHPGGGIPLSLLSAKITADMIGL